MRTDGAVLGRSGLLLLAIGLLQCVAPGRSQLVPMPTVIGTVSALDGTPIEGVGVIPLAHDTLLDVTDSAGRYALYLPPGRYAVKYRLNDVPATVDTLDVTSAAVVEHGVTLQTAPPAYLNITVQDVEGRPLRDASVGVQYGGAGRLHATDRQGRVRPFIVRPGWAYYFAGKDGFQRTGLDSVLLNSREHRHIYVKLRRP